VSNTSGGFRGYIASRPVRGTPFPQRVQNLVVRNHATRYALQYKLSLAEYAMPDCYMMLQTLLDELPRLDGVIVFSMFMLPSRPPARSALYTRVIDAGVELHAALEDLVLRTREDIALFEDTIAVAAALRLAPLRGCFTKTGPPNRRHDPFLAALRTALDPLDTLGN
jgi:sporadic carbohydrate cluster protein (TIGR04323 family)